MRRSVAQAFSCPHRLPGPHPRKSAHAQAVILRMRSEAHAHVRWRAYWVEIVPTEGVSPCLDMPSSPRRTL